MKEKQLKEKEESKSADSDEEHGADDDKRSIGSEQYSDEDVTSII